jgi:hypothetical protein
VIKAEQYIIRELLRGYNVDVVSKRIAIKVMEIAKISPTLRLRSDSEGRRHWLEYTSLGGVPSDRSEEDAKRQSDIESEIIKQWGI